MGTEQLKAALANGLRTFDPAGRMAAAPAGVAALDGHNSLFVVDLEMSGSLATMHEVLDVAGVRVRLEPGLPEVESWGTRVKPRHIGNAIPAALKVVGYSPKAWKTAAELEDAFRRFAALGQGSVLVGWGIEQDLVFIAESLKRCAVAWPFASVAIDVQPIARVVLKSGEHVDRFNLGHVADRLGIGRMGEHGALADAYATYDVLLKLLERG